MQHYRKYSKRRFRRGTSTVELAVCLPMLVLLVLGAIETTNLVFFKQAITASAYEAARVAVKNGQGETEATQRANEVLDARGVQEAEIEFEPSNIADLDRGTPISVTVSAPALANIVGPSKFSYSINIVSRISMVKE